MLACSSVLKTVFGFRESFKGHSKLVQQQQVTEKPASVSHFDVCDQTSFKQNKLEHKLL